MVCPIYRAPDVAFQIQDAPAFYKDPKEPVLKLNCSNCHNYWLNEMRDSHGLVAVDPATLATLTPFSNAERMYYSQCVQRLIDHNCWLIIGDDNAAHFLADLQKAVVLTAKSGSQVDVFAGYEAVRPLPQGFDKFSDFFAASRCVAMHWFG